MRSFFAFAVAAALVAVQQAAHHPGTSEGPHRIRGQAGAGGSGPGGPRDQPSIRRSKRLYTVYVATGYPQVVCIDVEFEDDTFKVFSAADCRLHRFRP